MTASESLRAYLSSTAPWAECPLRDASWRASRYSRFHDSAAWRRYAWVVFLPHPEPVRLGDPVELAGAVASRWRASGQPASGTCRDPSPTRRRRVLVCRLAPPAGADALRSSSLDGGDRSLRVMRVRGKPRRHLVGRRLGRRLGRRRRARCVAERPGPSLRHFCGPVPGPGNGNGLDGSCHGTETASLCGMGAPGGGSCSEP